MKKQIGISLADLEAFDPRAARGGVERRCRCPICQAKEPSFCFNVETGLYTCKRASCGANGKLSDFWTEKPRPNHRERAAIALRTAFDGVKGANPANTPGTATAGFWRELWQKAQPVAECPQGIDYLIGRGITLGAGTTANVRYLSYGGREWLVFPFTGEHGEIVAFQARATDGAENGHRAYGPKKAGIFLTSPDVLKAETIYITEAPIDALSLAMCGRHAIALGGVVASEWLLNAVAFRCVALAFDNDKNGAGRKAADELKPMLLSFGASTFRMKPQRAANESKSDWNMMLKELGVGRLYQWLNYYESKAMMRQNKIWNPPKFMSCGANPIIYDAEKANLRSLE